MTPMDDGEPEPLATLHWLRPDGAVVAAGEPVCELETDKAAAVLEAPTAGVLRHLAREGARVSAAVEFVRIDPLP